MKGLKKIRSILDKFLSVICSTMFAAIVCIITTSVTTRGDAFSPSRINAKGTNVIRATSFVMSMLVKKHRVTRAAQRARKECSRWHRPLPKA